MGLAGRGLADGRMRLEVGEGIVTHRTDRVDRVNQARKGPQPERWGRRVKRRFAASLAGRAHINIRSCRPNPALQFFFSNTTFLFALFLRAFAVPPAAGFSPRALAKLRNACTNPSDSLYIPAP
jgi:hypothetical protein